MNTLLRAGMLCAGLLALSGCNSNTASSYQTLKLAVIGQPSAITAEQARAVPGSSLVVRLGDAEALFVPVSVNGALVEWAGQAEVVVTHHGRITQVAGLPADPIVHLAEADPFITGLHTVAEGTTLHRSVDYPSRHLTGLTQEARYSRGPVEQVDILGSTLTLLRIDERIRMPELGFTATNRYWVDQATGFVHQSTQHIADDLPPMRMMVINPYGDRP